MSRTREESLQASQPLAYKVVSVSELDKLIFEQLVTEDAARPVEGEIGKYVVTDRKLAASTVVMPKILNRFGRSGWLLEAVNKMECYIFSRSMQATPVEYLVVTPPELDRLAITELEREGALRIIRTEEGSTQAVEVIQANAARIQSVLPQVLASIGHSGWKLCTVTGPQLYIFARAAN
jgi:hypothetical protein